MTHPVIPPPIYFMGCLVVGSLLERWRPQSIADYPFRPGVIVCAVLSAMGFGFALWAIATMTRHRTTIEPGEVPVRLVTSGPFRLSRNPIYVGLAIISFAIAVGVNSAWLLGTALLLVVLLDRLVIAKEERVIVQIFGDDYREYLRRVRRWL